MKYMKVLPMGIELEALHAGGAPLAAHYSQYAQKEMMLNPNGSYGDHFAGGGQVVDESDKGEGPVLARQAGGGESTKYAGFELLKAAHSKKKINLKKA